jgi:hypothetical protein
MYIHEIGRIDADPYGAAATAPNRISAPAVRRATAPFFSGCGNRAFADQARREAAISIGGGR